MIINPKRKLENSKKKELLLYFLFGLSTTLVNVLVFQCVMFLGLDYKVANLFALVFGKLYAYITNKKFVFRSRCESFCEALKEFLRFAYARGITGLIDYLGLIFIVEMLGVNPVWGKYGLQVLIIVLNYFMSKILVFKNTGRSEK